MLGFNVNFDVFKRKREPNEEYLRRIVYSNVTEIERNKVGVGMFALKS